MDKQISVEPVKGRLVRIPESGREMAGPTKVPANSFWLRRIASGDVRQTENKEVQK